MALRVDVADLLAGGVSITGHGEDIAMRHSAADSRIDAAHAGWQGTNAHCFQEMDQNNGQDFETLGHAADSVTG